MSWYGDLGSGLLDFGKGLIPGYNEQQNARDAHAGLQGYQTGVRAAGTASYNRYMQSKGGAQSRYDRANGTVNNWNRPAQVNDWYGQAQKKYGSATPYSVQNYTNTGGSNYQPHQAQDYYSGYNPNTYLQDYTSGRLHAGAAPSAVDQRAEALGREGAGYAADDLTRSQRFATGPTTAGQRMTDRGALGEDALDNRLREHYAVQPTELQGAQDRRTAYLNAKTASRGVLDETNDPQAFAQRTDAYSKDFAGQNLDKYTGEVFSNVANRGNDTSQFMDNYNPSQDARELSSTYGMLANEGPTYEEDFYNSQVAGQNPAYNMLQSDLTRNTARESAARGGFVAGRSMDMERQASARLAADEFARRGDLAAAAGTSRRAQQGQTLQAATSLDQQRQGGRALQLQGATSNDKLLSDLATTRDASAMEKGKYLGDLAKFGDTQGLDVEKLRGEVAKNEDMTQEQKQQALDQIAKQESDFKQTNQSQMDTVAQGLSNRDAERQRALDTLGISEDTTKTARNSDYLGQLTNADTYHTAQGAQKNALATTHDADAIKRQDQLDTLAKGSSDERAAAATLQSNAAKNAGGEQQDYLNYRTTAAANADTSDLNRDKYMGDLARMSSEEQATGQKDQFGAQMQLGDAQSAVDRAYDMAANGQMDETELAALDAQLQESGVDANKRAAIMNNVRQNIATGVSVAGAASGKPPTPPPPSGGGGGGQTPYGGFSPSSPYSNTYGGYGGSTYT